MTLEDAKKIMDLLAGFVNENEGNHLNRWLSVPLLNAVKAQLGEIIAKDEKSKRVKPEPQDESPEDKCPPEDGPPEAPIPRG